MEFVNALCPEVSLRFPSRFASSFATCSSRLESILSSSSLPPLSLFLSSLQIWNVDGGRLTHIGKVGLVEDAFEDGTPSATPGASTTTSAVPSRIGSRVGSRGASASTTPAGSGDESEVYSKVRTKKKKPTRNDIKAQEVRRAQRKLKWLTYGGEREMDTDEEDKPGVSSLALLSLSLARFRTARESGFSTRRVADPSLFFLSFPSPPQMAKD